MSIRPTRKLTFFEILVLQFYWISISFMWNSLHVIILPALLLWLVPETLKNTYLGLLTFAGLILAMIIQPLSGAISDRWVSPWGRRRPLILIGTVFDFFFLIFLGWAGGLAWLAFGYIGLQISSNIAHGPMQGLLPDQVPEEQLGRASGFKNFMDITGLIISSLLIGRLYNPSTRHPIGAICLIAGLLAVCASVTLLGVKEQPSTGQELSIQRVSLYNSFRIDWKKHRAFGWLILSRFFYLISIYGIQVFGQYFVRDVLQVENPVKLTGDFLALITIVLVVFTVFGGWLGDRLGHKTISLTASLIGGTGCFLLIWARTPQALLIFGTIMGIGLGLFLTANWALANELAPIQEAGKFMGLTNLATAGAGAIGRLEGPFIDILNNARPGAWWGYSALFLFGTICILISSIILIKIPTPELFREYPNKRFHQ